MQIVLQENEIRDAVSCYLSKSGMNLDGKEVSVKIVQGRGVSGRIECDITEAEVEVSVTTPKKSTSLFDEDEETENA